jgi:hypothetical protein
MKCTNSITCPNGTTSNLITSPWLNISRHMFTRTKLKIARTTLAFSYHIHGRKNVGLIIKEL